jgi:hypothetical protein
MKNFYVTFGQQYRHEEHPCNDNMFKIHPDKWVRIVADSIGQARNAAFEMFGDKWAFIYDEKEFKKDYFPDGELLSIEIEP